MARGPLRLSRAGRVPDVRRPAPGSLDLILRRLPGGKPRVMALASLAVPFEPRLAPVVALWQQMTPWQRRIRLDDLAAYGGLTASEFLAAIVRAAVEQGSPMVDLLVAAALPEAVEQTVRSAKRLDSRIGLRDRRLLLEHSGFLPPSPSMTVKIDSS